MTVFDLRSKADYDDYNIPNSVHLDIGANVADPSPFSHPPTLIKQWKALEAVLGGVKPVEKIANGKWQSKNSHLPDPKFNGAPRSNGNGLPTCGLVEKTVVVLSYNGDTASIASSILRNSGVEAFWVAGNVQDWKEAKLELWDQHRMA